MEAGSLESKLRIVAGVRLRRLCAAPVLAAALLAAAGAAQAGGGSLGDLATLTAPEVFSDGSLPTSGANFADDWTFNLSESVSGGTTVTSLDVIFDPSSSSSFSFTGLQTLSVAIYDSQTTFNANTLVGSQTVTNPSSSTAANLAFDNLSTTNLYTLVVSGNAYANSTAAAYTGVVDAVVVPEPASGALVLAGIAVLAAIVRRRAFC